MMVGWGGFHRHNLVQISSPGQYDMGDGNTRQNHNKSRTSEKNKKQPKYKTNTCQVC